MPILDKKNTEMVKKVDAFLQNSVYSNLHQSFEWAKVKSDKWKHEYVYVEENGEIIAAMLVLIRRMGKIFTMMYAPRGPVCDVSNVELVKKLIEETKPLAKKYHAFVLKMDPTTPYDEALIKQYQQNGLKVKSDCHNILEVMQPLRSMLLHIKGKTEEEVMMQYSSKTRYNVRLAQKKGVTVRWSRDEADLKTFYELMKVTAKRDDIAIRVYSYYKDILETYGEKARIYLAEYEGKALSGALTVKYGDKVSYFYGASSNENRNVMPNYLMQQTMIKWAIESGCNEYDFGGVFSTNKEEGIYRFKEGFCRQEGATRFIGELDKVYNSSLYFAFSKVLPRMERIIMNWNKKKQERR